MKAVAMEHTEALVGETDIANKIKSIKMTDKLKQIIKEEVEKSPKEVKEAINSLDWPEIAEDIGKNHSLNEGEINNLQVEILLSLVGVTDLMLFATHVENNVGTTKEESAKIMREVVEKIFTPISQKIEGSAKKNIANQDLEWQKSVDFITSGGNYSAFISKTPAQITDEQNNSTNLPNIHKARII